VIFLTCENVNELWTGVKTALEKKQDKLTGLTDQFIGFDEEGNPAIKTVGTPGGVATLDGNGVLLPAQQPCLAELKGGSNPNLLDNWYFANPVNQRGKKEYTEMGVMIDRWDSNSVNHAAVIETQGITFSSKGENACWFRQKLLQSAEVFLGKPCTLSLLDTDGNLYTETFTFSTTPNTTENLRISTDFGVMCWQRTSENSTSFAFYLNGNSSKTFRAAKLELGIHQTLAQRKETGEWEQIDPPPNKSLEQLKCLQYQLVLPYTSAGAACVGIGTPHSNTDVLVFIPTPVTLRKKPAISFLPDIWVLSCFGGWDYIGSTTLPVANIRMGYYAKNGIILYCNTKENLDTSRTYLLAHPSTVTQAALILDANL